MPGHDYQAPWKYHITILKTDEAESFSELKIEDLNPEGVGLKYSTLGNLIWRAIRDLNRTYIIEVIQYAIMPDHIHLLIQTKERLPRHLGYYIAEFKSGITKAYRTKMSNPKLRIFQENYADRVILPEHSLDDVYKYIKHNPYRLAVRKFHSEFFRKERNIFIDKREVQAYGNLFLFRNPFKISLVVHRTDDEKIIARKLEMCLYYAENGGVVVSAFISAKEKEIRRQVENAGGRIIIIQDRPFSDRGKPAAHDFALCCDGRLLIISPLDYLNLPRAEHPPRWQCLDMNGLGEKLCGQEKN